MSEAPIRKPSTAVDHVRPLPHTEVVLESDLPLAEVEDVGATLIVTEHEVLFSTAAAVSARRIRWWTRAARVIVSIARIFVRPPADSRPKRRDHPARFVYLEGSLMAREMDRL